jgi:hypothetical protein
MSVVASAFSIMSASDGGGIKAVVEDGGVAVDRNDDEEAPARALLGFEGAKASAQEDDKVKHNKQPIKADVVGDDKCENFMVPADSEGREIAPQTELARKEGAQGRD